MTIRRCSQHADLVSYPSCLNFLKNFYLLKEPNYLFHFTVSSQQCFYIILDLVFFSVILPLGAFLQAVFDCQFLVSICSISTVGCQLFLNIKCPWDSLACQTWSLLSLISYCLQLLWALFHSSMCSLLQYSLLVLFFSFLLPFAVSNTSDSQVVVCMR